MQGELIKSAQEWIYRILTDIESKVQAKDVPTGDKENPYTYRSEDEKERYREELFDAEILNDDDFYKIYGKYKEKN